MDLLGDTCNGKETSCCLMKANTTDAPHKGLRPRLC